VIVVGSGVFGAWTAWHLLKLGRKGLLLDAWGPAPRPRLVRAASPA
jgi:glycine/D-amino acid oxidase-like deaminating enzyme